MLRATVSRQAVEALAMQQRALALGGVAGEARVAQAQCKHALDGAHALIEGHTATLQVI